MIQPLQRDLTTFGIPAHLGRLGEAIDLPGLHQNPPRRETIGATVLIEPLHEASRRSIPTLPRPERQGSGRSCAASVCHDIVRTEPICSRGGPFFNHRVSRSVSNTDRRHLISRQGEARNRTIPAGPPMTDHYDALETREPAEREADLFAAAARRAAQGHGSARLCRAAPGHRSCQRSPAGPR